MQEQDIGQVLCHDVRNIEYRILQRKDRIGIERIPNRRPDTPIGIDRRSIRDGHSAIRAVPERAKRRLKARVLRLEEEERLEEGRVEGDDGEEDDGDDGERDARDGFLHL